jgi:hypothetical protein
LLRWAYKGKEQQRAKEPKKRKRKNKTKKKKYIYIYIHREFPFRVEQHQKPKTETAPPRSGSPSHEIVGVSIEMKKLAVFSVYFGCVFVRHHGPGKGCNAMKKMRYQNIGKMQQARKPRKKKKGGNY